MEQYSVDNNFKVTVSASDYDNGIPTRGSYICSSLSFGRQKSSKCSWCVNFLRQKNIIKYVFRKYELMHNHSTSLGNMIVDGK
jgi:hypothetical protein